MRIVIVGGGTAGQRLAEHFETHGENTLLIEIDSDVARRARKRGHSVHVGNGTSSKVLCDADVGNAKRVIVATGGDDANLLVAQLAHSTFEVEPVFARVKDPRNTDAFEHLDVRALSPTLATIWAIDNLIERPALLNWTVELGRSGDVREVDVTAEAVVGREIAAVRSELPSECLVALVSREGESRFPDDDFELGRGDTVTLLGRSEAVEEALSVFGSAEVSRSDRTNGRDEEGVDEAFSRRPRSPAPNYRPRVPAARGPRGSHRRSLRGRSRSSRSRRATRASPRVGSGG